jgi:flagellar protein FlaI
LFNIFKRRGKVEAASKVEKKEAELPEARFVEAYPILEPFVYVAIEVMPEGGLRYRVIEPYLSESEVKLLDQINQMLKTALSVDMRSFSSQAAAAEYLRGEVIKLLKRFDVKVPRLAFDKLMYYVVRDHIGYGVIDPLMRDPRLEDISCDGPGIPIYVWHRDYESLPTNIVFPDSEKLDKFLMRMAYLVGKHISVAQPIVEGALPDGSRIHMTYGSEVTKKGSTFTIRKFRGEPLTVVDLIKLGTLNSDIASMLWFALENKASILVVGGTASGKTTTINCLSMLIHPDAKIVTIEDTPEINLAHVNWVQSVSRPGIMGVGEVTLYDLLVAALRQRPDYIIVGEIRGAEAYTLFQAISTGHAGLSSMHAESVSAALRRLIAEPMKIPKPLVATLNYILLQARLTIAGKSSRKILSVTEIVGLDPRTEEFITNEVYAYSFEKDQFIYNGRSYIVEKIARVKGLSEDEVKRDLNERKMVLEWMVKKGIRGYREVTAVVGDYYRNKEALLNRVRIDLY